MNPSSFKIYKGIYFLICVLSLFFIDSNESITEMIFKIFTVVLIAFMYLTYTPKINYWYLLLLMYCIIADTLLIFEQDFLRGGVLFVVFTRFTYLIILKKTILNVKLRPALFYLIPCVLLFILLSYLLSLFIENILISVFIVCFLNLTVIGLSFYQYLNKMTRDNLYFMLGVFLITIADFIIAFNKYLVYQLDYQLYYVILYTVMYYVARYLICIAMINEKQ